MTSPSSHLVLERIQLIEHPLTWYLNAFSCLNILSSVLERIQLIKNPLTWYLNAFS